MDLEKRADEIFNSFISQISFALLYSGAGLLFGNPSIPCGALFVFTIMTVVVFFLAFFVALNVALIRKGRMNPNLNNMNDRRRALGDRAKVILKSEQEQGVARQSEQFIDIPDKLDPRVSVDELIHRCNVIVKSSTMIELSNYNTQMILTTIGCLVVHGSIFYYIAYFTYNHAKKGCGSSLQVI